MKWILRALSWKKAGRLLKPPLQPKKGIDSNLVGSSFEDGDKRDLANQLTELADVQIMVINERGESHSYQRQADMETSTKLYHCDCLSMSLTHSPQRNFSAARYSGLLTLNGFLESFKARYQTPTKFSLIDISELALDSSLSPEFLKALDSLLYSKSFDPNFVKTKHGSTTAIVIADSIQEGVALAFGQLFNEIGKVFTAVRTFYSESKAMKWLVEQGMPHEKSD